MIQQIYHSLPPSPGLSLFGNYEAGFVVKSASRWSRIKSNKLVRTTDKRMYRNVSKQYGDAGTVKKIKQEMGRLNLSRMRNPMAK